MPHAPSITHQLKFKPRKEHTSSTSGQRLHRTALLHLHLLPLECSETPPPYFFSHILQASMQITGPDTLCLVHGNKMFMRKQNYPSKTLRHLKQWCWQLVDLNLSNHLVDTAPALFANTKPTHHRCQCFIPGFWRRIYESLGIHQWLSGICNLNAIIEYLNH